MTRKIAAKDLAELAQIAGEVDGLFDELQVLADKFSDEAQTLIDKIVESAEPAQQIMEDAASDAESYYDEKSERWQESDNGSHYSEWKDRLREVADALQEPIEAPEITMPDRPDWVGALADPDFVEVDS